MSDALSPARPARKLASALAAGSFGALAVLTALTGCQPEAPKSTAGGNAGQAAPGAAEKAADGSVQVASQQAPTSVTAADYAKANELGLIPVLEYHRFDTKEERWTRTFDNFRKDLEFLYNNGYVPVNMRDVAEKKLNVPAGKKPIVLTFDDSTENQFRYLTGPDKKIKRDAAGKPVIDPNCAVGIMDAFAAKHPDFGRAGTFYVLPTGFEQDGVIGEKYRYLEAAGYEIGSHTWGHDDLSHLSAEAIKKSLSKLQAQVSQEIGHPYAMSTLALPNGLYPKSDAALQAVLAGGSGSGSYQHKLLLLVGSNPNVSPYDKRYKATAVARIQCIDSEFRNWFNRKPGSTAKTTEPWLPYVSDGDATKVTFPVSGQARFNPAALAPGQKANPWDPKKVAKTAEAPSAAPVAAASAEAPVAAQPSASAAAPAAAASAEAVAAVEKKKPSDTHPGYGVKLPKGGSYEDGKLTHTVSAGDSVEAIAYAYVRLTDAYTYPALASAIRQANGGNRSLKIGEVLTIPMARKEPPKAQLVPRPKNFEAKGIYVTGTTAGSEMVWKLVKDLKAHGGNTVVFDAKDMNGRITYASQVPLAKEIGAHAPGTMITDMPKFLSRMHAEGIHTVARVALFHDDLLAHKKPQFALRSKRTGAPWRELGVLGWVDPSLPAVQDYNLAIAKEMLAMGVDEIQYDYVRFPAQGDTLDIAYHAQKEMPAHHQVITDWLKRANAELKPSGALISADVYGVVAWDQGIDVKITGQKLEEMGLYLDAISPMLYPSHFYGNFDKFSYPPDHPDYFISEGVKRVAKKTAGTGVMIRPWLQAFPYRIRNYGPDYVATQLKANTRAAGTGWLLWNAENNYNVGFAGVASYHKVGGGAGTAPVKP